MRPLHSGHHSTGFATGLFLAGLTSATVSIQLPFVPRFLGSLLGVSLLANGYVVARSRPYFKELKELFEAGIENNLEWINEALNEDQNENGLDVAFKTVNVELEQSGDILIELEKHSQDGQEELGGNPQEYQGKGKEQNQGILSKVNPESRWILESVKHSLHGFICGETGSGKSTLVNNFICTILNEFGDDGVEIVIIDGKFPHTKWEINGKEIRPQFIGFESLKDDDDNYYPTAIEGLEQLYQDVQDRLKTDAQAVLSGRPVATHPKRIYIIDEFEQLVSQYKQRASEPVKSAWRLARSSNISVLVIGQDPGSKAYDMVLANLRNATCFYLREQALRGIREHGLTNEIEKGLRQDLAAMQIAQEKLYFGLVKHPGQLPFIAQMPPEDFYKIFPQIQFELWDYSNSRTSPVNQGRTDEMISNGSLRFSGSHPELEKKHTGFDSCTERVSEILTLQDQENHDEIESEINNSELIPESYWESEEGVSDYAMLCVLKNAGTNQNNTIKTIWNVSKGNSPRYRIALKKYKLFLAKWEEEGGVDVNDNDTDKEETEMDNNDTTYIFSESTLVSSQQEDPEETSVSMNSFVDSILDSINQDPQPETGSKTLTPIPHPSINIS